MSWKQNVLKAIIETFVVAVVVVLTAYTFLETEQQAKGIDLPVVFPGDVKYSKYTVNKQRISFIQDTCNGTCAVNCSGSFSAASSCSVSCGGGVQTQTFVVTTAASSGGTNCSYSNGTTSTIACNTQACGTNPTCSSYSASCPTGQQAASGTKACSSSTCTATDCCINATSTNATCVTYGSCPTGQSRYPNTTICDGVGGSCEPSDCCYTAPSCASFTCAFNQMLNPNPIACLPSGCTSSVCCSPATCTTSYTSPTISVAFYSDVNCTSVINKTTVPTNLNSYQGCSCASIAGTPTSSANLRCSNNSVSLTEYYNTTTCDVRATGNALVLSNSSCVSMGNGMYGKISDFSGCASWTAPLIIAVVYSTSQIVNAVISSTGYSPTTHLSVLPPTQLQALVNVIISGGTKVLQSDVLFQINVDVNNVPVDATGNPTTLQRTTSSPKSRIKSFGLGVAAAVVVTVDPSQALAQLNVVLPTTGGLWMSDVISFTRFTSNGSVVSASAVIFQINCTSNSNFKICRFDTTLTSPTCNVIDSSTITGPDSNGFCTIPSPQTSAFVAYSYTATSTNATCVTYGSCPTGQSRYANSTVCTGAGGTCSASDCCYTSTSPSPSPSSGMICRSSILMLLVTIIIMGIMNI